MSNESKGVRVTSEYTYFTAIFVGMLVAANILAVKPVAVAGGIVPAGVVTYALTFLVTDTVGEVWGRERTQHLVWAGFVTSLLVAVFVRIAIWAPGAPFWQDQPAFVRILGVNMRLVIASMIAYLVSQSHDVWAFHALRRLTGGKHLWLRNNASTLVSQFLDTAIFITLAFYGVWGGWDVIWPAIVGQYLVKVIIALLDTPFIYAAVWWVRRALRKKESCLVAIENSG